MGAVDGPGFHLHYPHRGYAGRCFVVLCDEKDALLAAVNTGSKKRRGALWYGIGRYVYVPLAIILCCVALFMKIAF